MSFPFLLSAVPLYVGDVTNRRADGIIPRECCWFSDGGLTSNFPIHFFDSPLPSRPTFGINLVPASVAMGDAGGAEEGHKVTGFRQGGGAIGMQARPGWDKIYMPSSNASGIGSTARFNKFSDVAGFFSALFDTARNWGDTELMAMPGYRDRIVHVALTEDEGGLNLNMPEAIINRVGERGRVGGRTAHRTLCLWPPVGSAERR